MNPTIYILWKEYEHNRDAYTNAKTEFVNKYTVPPKPKENTATGTDRHKFMKKNIANIITGSRIVLSLPLLLIPLPSAWFYILYIICGLTDMLDGAIAKKTGAFSHFGATLDTAADFVFILVCSIKILPQIHIPVWLWVWVIVVALVKIFNIALVFIQEKKLILIHSILNKATGLALFLWPFSLTVINTAYSVTLICALATIATTQEVYFVAKKQEIL